MTEDLLLACVAVLLLKSVLITNKLNRLQRELRDLRNELILRDSRVGMFTDDERDAVVDRIRKNL